jgi:hypothetical protein
LERFAGDRFRLFRQFGEWVVPLTGLRRERMPKLINGYWCKPSALQKTYFGSCNTHNVSTVNGYVELDAGAIQYALQGKLNHETESLVVLPF